MKQLELTLDQKFARTLLKLRDLRPFFSAVYESMPHVETGITETMAVTGKELLYNKEWCEKLTFPQFMFVTLHEITHIALLHVPRCEKRDRVLWNIAADLYSNKLLAKEFDIEPGKITKDGNVEFLSSGLYCSSIDIDVETTESIYESLYKQAKLNEYNKDKESLGDEAIKRNSYKFTYEGIGVSHDKYSTFEIKIDETLINENKLLGDLLNDGSDASELEGLNKQILAEAKTKFEMIYKNAGYGSGILESLVSSLLTSYIDWKKLLRKYCIDIVSRDSSFKTPDKRMYYQQAIYPGALSDADKALDRVKLCFDRSGSISDDDTRYFYGQAKQLLKQFKVKAEVINWDTDILSRGTMEDPTNVKSAQIIHGGGTNPTCIFKYFDSKECLIKPIVTIIFTDGYINFCDNPKWHKQYKNTIWVMTRNYNKNFKPSFGKITVAKFNE